MAADGRGEAFNMEEGPPPELAESAMYLHQATSDPAYLELGKQIVTSLQQLTRVPCGFASMENVVTKELTDIMDSFFLAETIKCAPRAPGRGSRFSLACSFRYLFLLFDASLAPEKRLSLFCPSDRPSQNANSTCIRPIQTLFSTEGHVFLLDSVDGQCESGPVGGR